MNKKIVIAQMNLHATPCYVMALIENDSVMELQVHSMNESALLGNIYIGKVVKTVSQTNGAFVDIKPGFSCYLSLNEFKDRKLKNGDEILVQVSQEALKTKVPKVSANINLTGKYMVVTSGNPGLGISSKLDIKKKKELKELVLPYYKENTGVIIRTNAALAKSDEIIEELRYLYQKMDIIQSKGKTRTCYSLIDKSMPFYISILRNLNSEDLEKIVTDVPDVYDDIKEYLNEYQPVDSGKLYLYEDKLLPLYKLYSLEHELESALNQKVWLKNGGFLMIQQTEAFVAIDVNSGKYSSKKTSSETFRKINHEAAKEIARQLRLRNLYGIILIDFINMNDEKDRNDLLNDLTCHFNRDSVKTQVIDMTKLQITEVTRKKIRKSLYEQIYDFKNAKEGKNG